MCSEWQWRKVWVLLRSIYVARLSGLNAQSEGFSCRVPTKRVGFDRKVSAQMSQPLCLLSMVLLNGWVTNMKPVTRIFYTRNQSFTEPTLLNHEF